MNKNIGIVKLYCGQSGKIGFYNSQEIGEAKAFLKKGYNSYVFICSKENKTVIEKDIEGIKVFFCPGISIGVHGKFDWNILLQYKIDIIQINSDNQFFVGNLVRFCKKNNINYYCYIGTISVTTNSNIKRFISGLFIKKNLSIYKQSKCFSKTEFVQKELKTNKINSILAPVGLDTTIIPFLDDNKNDTKTKLRIPLDKKILLFVGRLEEYKDPLSIIEVIKNMSDSYAIVIGSGSLSNELVTKIKKEKLEKSFRLIEEIANKEIHNYYAIADYFLNFNKNEIFGMSILEAMYQGCNAIAIDAPGPRTIINNGIDGFIVEDVNNMRNIVIENKKCNSKLIKERITNNFTWDATVKTIIDNL